MRVRGKVYLVGAGPGDPKLITLKALEVLRQADVVIYDRLVSPNLLLQVKESAERIYAGKKKNKHTLKQEEINQLLVDHAQQGKVVVRLKGGDPMVFGRGGEEAEVLAEHGIDYEIVPGISSIYAVPAYAGIPVTHRDYASSFYVVTGHESPEKLRSSIHWEFLVHAADTLIFLMGVSRLDVICEQLMRHGRSPDTPVALIRWGTRAEQRTLIGTLGDIVRRAREAKFLPPAVIVAGDVVRLRDKLLWAEKRPLFGKRILVTRSRSQASELAKRIEELGGEAVTFPVLQFAPIRDEARLAALDEAIASLAAYDWLVFTSVNGVEYFFRRVREKRQDIRQIRGRIAAVGPRTAEALLGHGLVAEELPDLYQAEGLAELLLQKLQPGERVLIPRSSIARDYLPETLRAAGYEADAVDVYDNLPMASHTDWIVDMLRMGDLHVITFASSSSVHYFIEALRQHGVKDPSELANRCQIACIGPLTEAAAKEHGLNVSMTAREATIESLVAALCEWQDDRLE